MNVNLSSPELVRIWDSLKALPTKFPGSVNLPLEAQYLVGCTQLPQFNNTLRGLLSPNTHCPFCNPQKYCDKKPVEETHSFYYKENDFPRSDAEMYLIIPKRHVTDPSRLDDISWTEIGFLFKRVLKRLGKSGTLLMRYGSPLHHVGTVPHLHFNVIVSHHDKLVLLPVGKTEEVWERGYSQFHSWMHELSLSGGLEKLFAEA